MNEWMIWYEFWTTIRYDITSHPFTLMQQLKSLRAFHCMNESNQSQVKVKSTLYGLFQFKCTVQYSTVRELTWHAPSIHMNEHDMTTWHVITADDSSSSTRNCTSRHGTVNNNNNNNTFIMKIVGPPAYIQKYC